MMDVDTDDTLELVPEDVPKAELADEVNLRSCRAGYTDRDGRRREPKIQAVIDWGRVKLNVWPRDEFGQLIE